MSKQQLPTRDELNQHRLRQHEAGTHDRTEALRSYAAMFGHTGASH